MLQIYIRNEDSSIRRAYWNVGDSEEDEPVYSAGLGEIMMVFADGSELDHIRAVCRNIPDTNGDCVQWHGEMAQFIAVNIGAVEIDFG